VRERNVGRCESGVPVAGSFHYDTGRRRKPKPAGAVRLLVGEEGLEPSKS